MAKGLSSSHAAIGGVVATNRVMEPFLSEKGMFLHGITFGGHPVMCAIALKNIEIIKREGILEHVREHEDAFRSTLAQLLELPIVGDLRGTGFFYAIELVKDKDTRETFTDEESERLLRGFLSNALFERGLICRADDRGDPVVQISPPLVAGQAEFDEIVRILGEVLEEAATPMRCRSVPPASSFAEPRAASAEALITRLKTSRRRRLTVGRAGACDGLPRIRAAAVQADGVMDGDTKLPRRVRLPRSKRTRFGPSSWRPRKSSTGPPVCSARRTRGRFLQPRGRSKFRGGASSSVPSAMAPIGYAGPGCPRRCRGVKSTVGSTVLTGHASPGATLGT